MRRSRRTIYGFAPHANQGLRNVRNEMFDVTACLMEMSRRFVAFVAHDAILSSAAQRFDANADRETTLFVAPIHWRDLITMSMA
jgi:hypothetical protein